jgi:hypothetical protein
MMMTKMLQAVLTTAVLAATPHNGKAKAYCCTNPAICKAACGSACCKQRITTAQHSVLTKPVLPHNLVAFTGHQTHSDC